MNDFNFDLFKNTIISELGIKKDDITISLDKWGFDVAINYPYEDISSVTSLLNNHPYLGEYIFDSLDGYDTIYLKVPAIRSILITENFSPKVSQKAEDYICIEDKNSKLKLWVDVKYEDGEPFWEYNQSIFSTLNYKDNIMWYLQHNENMFYIIDEVVSENYKRSTL